MQSKSGFGSPSERVSDVARGGAIKAAQYAGESVQRAGEQAQRGGEYVVENVKKTAEQTRGRVRRVLGCILQCIRNLMARYPPLAAFFVSLVATSSLPIGVFTGFTLLTLGTLSAIALTVVGVIESGLLMFSGTILFFVLCGCSFISVIAASALTLTFFGLKISRWVWNRVMHGRQAAHMQQYRQSYASSPYTSPQYQGGGPIGQYVGQAMGQMGHQADQAIGSLKETVTDFERTGAQAREQRAEINVASSSDMTKLSQYQ